MQKIFERYFSFQGRLGRARFYIRSLYIGLIGGVLFVMSTPLFSSENAVAWWAGLGVAAAAGASLILGAASLIVRRLHDIGLSGYHAIWVGAAELSWPILSRAPERVVLLALPLFAICAWLIFWPGKAGENRFGLQTT